MLKFMCDFETSTEAWLEQDNYIARVWAGCIATITEQPRIVALTNNLDDFMKEMFKLGNAEFYYHNLRYDGEYIVAYLLTHGYKYEEGAKHDMTFDTLIDDMGQWYNITITHKMRNKKPCRANIYDSLKKLPLKVSQIAKAFKLEESKGEIDYDKYRPIGYELTPEEIEYIENDCKIVAKALYLQFTKGLDKMTVGADALSEYKNEQGRKCFDYLYPQVRYEVDNDFRLAYKGGFTMANPAYRNKVVSGISFDVNSLYPSVMYGLHGLLPYGMPIEFKGEYIPDRNYPLYIIKIHVDFKVKQGMIPTIQCKMNPLFMPTEYIKDSKGITDLVLTSVDFELFKEHYDIRYIEYVGGYKFKGSKNLFTEYIDYWSKIKAESTGGMRQLAKLMLNSLYGKFATNPERRSKIPVLLEDGIVGLELTDPKLEKPVYTALGCFITARARAYTIRNSQRLYKHWVYSDTDSMYLTGITEEQASKYIEIHPTKLGAWKCEHHFTKFKALRAKTYIMNSVEDGITITCAGMPDNIKQEIIALGEEKAFKRFTYGAKFEGKLAPKRVEGGIILKKVDFTIKDIK